MTKGRMQHFIGHSVIEVRPILDSKGKPTKFAFLVFDNNLKLKVEQR